MIIENTGGQQTVLATAMADYKSTFDRQIQKGMDKYGVVLKTFNARDAGRDAFEELVDLSVYLEQLRMEHRAMAEILYFIHYQEDYNIPESILTLLEVMNADIKLKDIAMKWGLKVKGETL